MVPLKASSYTPPNAKSRIITATMYGVGTSLVPLDRTAACHRMMSASGKPAPKAMARTRRIAT